MCLCAGQKMQDMDERRIRRLAEGYCQFSDIERKVLPIISKCLEGITTAGKKINEKQVNVVLSYCRGEQHIAQSVCTKINVGPKM